MIQYTCPSITFADLIGEDDSFLQAKNRAKRFAESVHPVYISGETGTGKGLFANVIHYESPFSGGPFLQVNCSAVCEEELEDKLFHDSGLDPGTLFLDEVWGLSLSLQGKLLAAIEQGIGPRLISSSSVPLRERVENDEFRMDLYYRLNVLDLPLPPLRERKSDIPLLVHHFLRSGDRDIYVEPVVWKALEQYEFRGNVRELKNMADYMKTVSDQTTVQLYDIPPALREHVDKKKTKDKKNAPASLTLMEKEEFAFLLETIKQLNEKGEPASRRILSEQSKNGKSELTPQQVRNRLDYLEKREYVTKGRGRAGTKITLEGLRFLSSLKNHIIQD
ncbi:sigma 54-interacting transcriptional regulator [Bacillus glycinifermentans]|uniref:sigma 54-interacting transcriptional regulator n=1 Tax=Bacillus glycinifermentans TaxID=1664069 RepID=UPI001FF27BD4|nr:sigma 54-interacting transcriptional regulator [Bacillus glycinifermentans]UOY89505.1 sigma 54-interacting transcriptional regulator [Bacillus glycinifermentans]